MNSLIIIGLCIGLLAISALYQPPKSYYDQSRYADYPIELMCDFVKVIDGDTVVLACPPKIGDAEKTLRSVRIWGIDAPELKQKHWGYFAKNNLKTLINNVSLIKVRVLDQDRYQRVIAKLYIDNIDLGLEMVKLGAATVYHRYNQDQSYINAEKKAKMMRLGIWRIAGEQQTPENWRRFNP